jgi:hypothetical protein
MNAKPVPLMIDTFFHCKQCMEELPAGISPREWNRSETGFTSHGIQVWCTRHNTNIAHFNIKRSADGQPTVVDTKEGP